ncbi:hypothetical protein BGZ83_006383 [Gryganskiella cystojenkinii]|nr:hypothetical protein BGZ83_006383 [Gryganskiella cystojenkinii]
MIALATGTSAGAGIDPIVIAAGGPFEISQFRPLTVYYFLFILAEIFAVGLLWDAAIHKNSLQVVAFTLFEWCMVSYSGLQIWQHDQLVKDIGIPAELLVRLGDSTTRLFLFTQLGVQIVACSGITLLTWRLYSEFGWLVFQKLGADVSLRTEMMKEYRLLFTLLKLDAFFFLAYAIQIATLTDKLWQKGLIEVAVAIPLSALRHENKVTMSGFISCLGLLIAYMTYRIYALYQTVTGDRMTDPYFLSRKTMTVFAALTLFMTVLALINAIVMVCNFNKGLKEAMQQYHLRRSNTIRSVTTVSLHHLPHLHPHNNHTLSGSGRPLSLDAIHSDTARGNGRHGLGPGHGRGSSGCRAAVAIVRSSTIKSHAPTDSGGGEGGGSGRNSKRTSRRSMLHCESTTTMTPAPVVMERWQIE